MRYRTRWKSLEATSQGSRWRRSGSEPRGLRRVTFQSPLDWGARRGRGHVDERDRASWRLTRRLLCPYRVRTWNNPRECSSGYNRRTRPWQCVVVAVVGVHHYRHSRWNRHGFTHHRESRTSLMDDVHLSCLSRIVVELITPIWCKILRNRRKWSNQRVDFFRCNAG